MFVTWFDEVYKIGDVDVTFHIKPGESHAVVKELTNRITQQITVNDRAKKETFIMYQP